MTHEKKARLLAAIGAAIVRLLIATLRFRITDHARVLATPPEKPLVWAFWHNRLFVAPYLFEHFFSGRRGAALASASKDGEIIAAFMHRFGIRPIRGSSSRGGARALVEMKRAFDAGFDLGITPDGPRGPRYSLNPGVVKLAQVTAGTILPLRIRYSRFWRLKTWDGFMIPMPFAIVEITLDTLIRVSATADEAAFEAERVRVERLLHPPEGDERAKPPGGPRDSRAVAGDPPATS